MDDIHKNDDGINGEKQVSINKQQKLDTESGDEDGDGDGDGDETI